MPVTFATALYDINRPDGRSFESYLPHFQRTLLLREPMVIFLDESKRLRPSVEAIRSDIDAPTMIIETSLCDIPCYWMLPHIQRILQDTSFSHHPTDITFQCPLYVCVQYSKFKWAQMAMQRLPNNYICWIDAGISRFFPGLMEKLSIIPTGDLCFFRPLGVSSNPPVIGSCECVVRGTMWFATRKGLDLDLKMESFLQEMLRENHYDNEQVALAHLGHREPSLFSWIECEASTHLPRHIFESHHSPIEFKEGNQTELCHIMTNFGSDKGNGWHTYTQVYSALFHDVREKSLSLFELGLGTTSLDFPSSMGPNGKPMASLYGWRDYFPQAHIYGADIDRSILQNEERIQTFYVDQRDGHSIRQMWTEMKDVEFDIIIDDGLHELTANLNFLKHSLHKLKTETGIYVMEDVRKTDLTTLREKLSQFPVTFDIIELTQGNPHDNNLCVIRRPLTIPRSIYLQSLHMMPFNQRIAFFGMCSYQAFAWEKSIESLRKFYPNAPFVIVNDGFQQFNYESLASKFQCLHLSKERQLLLHFFNNDDVSEFFHRLLDVCSVLPTGIEWLVHWHADMECRGVITHAPPGPLCGLGDPKQNGLGINNWNHLPRVMEYIRKRVPRAEMNGWGSAGGSIIHIPTLKRVYHALPSMDLDEIRSQAWVDAFKHDDTTLAILFELCGYPYRAWKDNVEQRSLPGAFLHGVKDHYDYVKKGQTLKDHHNKCARENQR